MCQHKTFKWTSEKLKAKNKQINKNKNKKSRFVQFVKLKCFGQKPNSAIFELLRKRKTCATDVLNAMKAWTLDFLKRETLTVYIITPVPPLVCFHLFSGPAGENSASDHLLK